MTQDEMITLVHQELKRLSSKLDSDDFANACSDAARDTGWAFPISGTFRIFWQKQRAKRHLFFMLLSESLPLVKVNQLNMNQRVDNYMKVIEKMDEDFRLAMEENMDEYLGVDDVQLMGTKADAGFRYESQTGRDLTYSDDSKVKISPSEND